MTSEFAGAMTERVAIETWIDVRDGAGAVAGFWRPEGQVAAAVVPDQGSGAGIGAAVGEARRSRRRWRVTLRAPVAVGVTSRLLWNSERLAVLAVDRDPRARDRVTLRCEAREA